MKSPDANATLLQLGLVGADDLESAVEGAAQLARAVNVPLRRLSAVDLYLLLRANLALPAVVPVAIERLADTPYLQAAEYPGDLLTALLESDGRYWLENRDAWEETLPILAMAMEQAQTTAEDGEVTYAIGDSLAAAVLHFMGHHKA